MSRHTFHVLLACLLAGTGCNGGRSHASSTPIALSDFCTEITDALCAAVAECDCGALTGAECQTGFLVTCTEEILGESVMSAITSGEILYSESAAGQVVGKFKSTTSCGSPFDVLRWTLGEAMTFGGTFTGTKEAGEACSGAGDLSSGSCRGGACNAGRCIGFVGLGDTCDETHLCVDTAVRLSGDLEEGDFLFPCEPSEDGESGTCVARRSNGEACDSSRECASGRCADGACAAKAANGEACGSSSECTGGNCDWEGAGSAQCASHGSAPNGTSCESGNECASDECDYDGETGAGACVDAICDID